MAANEDQYCSDCKAFFIDNKEICEQRWTLPTSLQPFSRQQGLNLGPHDTNM